MNVFPFMELHIKRGCKSTAAKIIIVIMFSFLGGVVQTVTGFGGGIVMLLALPYFFGVRYAPPLSSAIGLALSGSLMFKFIKKIDYRKIAVPFVIYTIVNIVCVRLAAVLDTRIAGLCYGIFLLLLAVWFFFLSGIIKFTDGTFSMLLATVVSGAGSGFFAIGGPLMAVYFAELFTDKAVYLGSLQAVFFVANVASLAARIANGLYTAELIPYTALGIVGIMTGRQVGLHIVGKLDSVLFKKIIYIFVAVSGLLTIIKYI